MPGQFNNAGELRNKKQGKCDRCSISSGDSGSLEFSLEWIIPGLPPFYTSNSPFATVTALPPRKARSLTIRTLTTPPLADA